MSNNLSVTYVGQCSAGHNLKPCQRLLKIYFIEHCSSVNVDIEKVFQHLMVPQFFCSFSSRINTQRFDYDADKKLALINDVSLKMSGIRIFEYPIFLR